MTQSRSVSYDDIIIKILPLINKVISTASNQKKGIDLSSDKKAVDNAIQEVVQLSDDVKTIKNKEKDPNKLSVLNDISLLLSFLQWGTALKKQYKEAPFSFVYSVSKSILWSKMPRCIVDNRGLVELSNDILSKSESIKQKK